MTGTISATTVAYASIAASLVGAGVSAIGSMESASAEAVVLAMAMAVPWTFVVLSKGMVMDGDGV